MRSKSRLSLLLHSSTKAPLSPPLRKDSRVAMSKPFCVLAPPWHLRQLSMRMARTCLVKSSCPLASFSAWSAGGGAAGAARLRRIKHIADKARAFKRVVRHSFVTVGSPAGGGKALPLLCATGVPDSNEKRRLGLSGGVTL